MTKVECSLLTCVYNDKSLCKSGICKRDGIVLKWRFAADMGKGNIVCVECMFFELPQ